MVGVVGMWQAPCPGMPSELKKNYQVETKFGKSVCNAQGTAKSPPGGLGDASWALFIMGHCTLMESFPWPQNQVFAYRVQSRHLSNPGCCLEEVSKKPS